jgi:hypothetical protein
MVTWIKNTNDWWDSLDVKSKFIWWFIFSLVVPVILYIFGLVGLYFLVVLFVAIGRFWKLYGR